ncbi:hypothetical protein KR067_013743 [Drosophila pandora]|nr:hypothetical protein KR067_013743 [Drosophila pandora]
MQRYKELYKEQSLALSPRNHCQSNRERQRAARAKQREDVFHSNRIISISPTPIKAKHPPPPSPQIVDVKENLVPKQEKSEEAEQKAPQQPICTEPSQKELPGTSKTARHQQFLQRFMQWKNARKEERKQQIQARRGAPAATAANQTTTFHQSKAFQAPKSVAAHPEEEGKEDRPVFVPPKRASIYVIANPTTKGKAKEPSAVRLEPIRTQRVATTAGSRPKTTIPTPSSKPSTQQLSKTPALRHPVGFAAKPQSLAKQPLKPASVRPQTNTLRPRVPSGTAVRTTIPKPMPARPAIVRPRPPSALRVKSQAPSALNAPAPAPKLANVRNQPFERPAVNRVAEARGAKITKPQPIRGGGGAASKFKASAATKNMAVNKSTRMKAGVEKKSYMNLQKKARLMPDLKSELIEAATVELPPNTPLEDHHGDNPFLAQNTSTQFRTHNGNASLEAAFGDLTSLSPLAPAKCEGENSAKRQLLPPEEAVQKPLPAAKKKFDFTRYSVANTPLEDSLILDPLPQMSKGIRGDSVDSTLVPAMEKTPPRRDSLPNYLSPFVSVSRGKVNSRSEREKRNSMYLPDEDAPVEVRRAIESVLYFRLQLENEVKRLHSLCSEWEAYSRENETRLMETGGMDMINVTIGQTRLLTSKKMMQFSGLIDRCEEGATGKNRKPDDGSEDTKPVQPEDLEGWWDMLRLQSENVDKRFDNLNRWKANDWVDPDAVVEEVKEAKPEPKAKPKLTRNMKIKSKAKPSSSLQQFLRKAHADMKKTKVEEVQETSNAPSTPKRRSSRVFVVRDRKSFSPARTVIRMSTGEGRTSIAPNALLKTALIAAAEQNVANKTPPRPRTSILKTPGTLKRQNRGVIFSAKKKVRRFEFTYDEGNISDGGIDKLEDCEEDMSLEERRSLEKRNEAGEDSTASAGENGRTPRSYTLRNRRVHLRPSSEFM